MVLLESLLAHARFGWNEAFYAKAFVVPRFVLASDLCNAFVMLAGGRACVVVGLGLLRALAYFQEWLHLGARAAPWLEGPGGLSTDETHHLLYASCLPLVHHVRDGCVLPRAGAVLARDDRAGCQIGLATAAQFLLMHEIGHAVLGHCDEDGVGPPSLDIAPTAVDAARRAEEFEADQFVFDALSPGFRQLTAGYGFNVLMMAALLERHLGEPTTHPAAPARMRALLDRLGDNGAPFMADEYHGLMAWYGALPSEAADPAEGQSYGYGLERLADLVAAYRSALAESPDPPVYNARTASPAEDWNSVATVLWPRQEYTPMA